MQLVCASIDQQKWQVLSITIILHLQALQLPPRCIRTISAFYTIKYRVFSGQMTHFCLLNALNLIMLAKIASSAVEEIVLGTEYALVQVEIVDCVLVY